MNTGIRTRRVAGKIVTYLLLGIGSLVMLAPLLWMLSTALKSNIETFAFPPELIPEEPRWSNFAEAIGSIRMWILARNTAWITAMGIVGTLFSSSLVAFALARIDFAGRSVLFILIISTMMVPVHVLLIPQFILFSRIGWIDTFRALIVPEWFGASAFNIFLLRQFFVSIPKELDESATIDGAGKLRIYWSIVMPLSKPALAAIGIFAFMYNWNDYIRPLIFLESLEKRTLSLGLTLFQTTFTIQWNLTMAASLLVVIPCLVAFFLGQRYFIQGVTMTGLKG